MKCRHIYSSQCATHQYPVSDQQEVNAENHTQLPYHAHFNDILTEYPAWSNNTNDIENTNPDQYRSHRQEILTAWQKDTPINVVF